jgi:hypothetical protein
LSVSLQLPPQVAFSAEARGYHNVRIGKDLAIALVLRIRKRSADDKSEEEGQVIPAIEHWFKISSVKLIVEGGSRELSSRAKKDFAVNDGSNGIQCSPHWLPDIHWRANTSVSNVP